MDKNSIRILEGVGYVAAVLTGAAALLQGGSTFDVLPWIGLMLVGIVVVRLAAVAAQGHAAEPAAKGEPAEEAEEERTA